MKSKFYLSVALCSSLFAQDSLLIEKIEVLGDPIEQTTAGKVDRYQALSADSATKTRTSLKEIPQSIQVITAQVIEDQQALTVSEVLRNVSGIVTNNIRVAPVYEGVLVRGFKGDFMQDGSNLFNNTGDRESLINVERIEVLKGPNAIIYGGNSGSPEGGAINLVSKMPEKEAFGKIDITTGSNGLLQPAFDINQPLSDSFLFRMTGEYTKSESEVDVLERQIYNINPTLKWLMNPNTALTLQGKISRWKGQDYQGLPATGSVAGAFKIDRNLFIGDQNLPDTTSDLNSIAAILDHKFNDIWSLNAKVRSANSDVDERIQLFGGNTPDMAPSTWFLFNTRMYQQQQDRSISADLKGEFSSQTTKTTLLVGAEYSKIKDVGFMDNMMMSNAYMVDLTNPLFSQPYVDENTGKWEGKVDNKTSGIFAQVQHSMYGNLHLLGGVKLAKIEVDYSDNFGADDLTEKIKLLPRAGIVYDLNPNISVFASYSEGIRGQGWANYTSTPKPTETSQKEAGLKFDVSKELSGSMAVFEIDRKNVGIADPAAGVFTKIPDGEEESKGFEVDLTWQPNSSLSILANYAHTDATYTKNASTTILAGNRKAGVPENSGRIWANYKVIQGSTNGLSMGAGVYAQSDAMITGVNDYKAPGFYTVDAKVGYALEKYEATLNVKNLTNNEYFEYYSYFGGRVAPSMGRQFMLNLAMKF
jgi:iron complex outermembrane receptor protein